MAFDPVLAEMRFGCGLSPVIAPIASVEAMLGGLKGPDSASARFPIERFSEFRARMVRAQDLRKVRRDERGTEAAKAARKATNLEKKDARIAQGQWLSQHIQRRVWSETAFRERLAWFWADHFTAQGKAGVLRRGTSPYVEETIRPNMTGRFADLVIAATTAPLMLHYLDQERSVGPNSPQGLKNAGKTGLNENLAREVLELHTLGVGGPYSQDDVRQLAELFTGMAYQPQNGFVFRKPLAEPGAETVLGVSYGGDQPRLSDILEALTDLARHPATARHIAHKLAVHFVSDHPDEGLVADVAQRFSETEGDLFQVYTALLEHPAAWDPQLQNVKQPFEFMASTMRALALPPDFFKDMDEKKLNALLRGPLLRMGQPWELSTGPDGWAEEDEVWMNPQGLAARMDWALRFPAQMVPDLPDPRDFVSIALGAGAPEQVRFAAGAAEDRREGIMLILTSPAFQRK